ncbi:MAG: ribosome maturation factor RimM [Ethanoligenens sp.]
MARKRFLETGKIMSTQGLRGEVRVQPWCDNPDFLMQFDGFFFQEGKSYRKVTSARVQKSIAVLKFEGVDSVEDAMGLLRQVLYIDRNAVELPEGSYFEQDLLGLSVMDARDGHVYGKLTEVLQTGANDVYVITGETGKEVLIPAIPTVVQAVDIELGTMHIIPLKGLFDDAD